MSDDALSALPLGGRAWTIKASRIGQSGQAGRIEASEADRQALAQALGILSCDRLVVDYRIKSIGRDRYKASGNISADLVQACVATLEPVPETIEEEFASAFWPADEIGEDAPDGEIHLDEDMPEPIAHGEIALGRLIYELVSLAMEPFPRSANAPEPGDAPEGGEPSKPDNPFAALAKLKNPS